MRDLLFASVALLATSGFAMAAAPAPAMQKVVPQTKVQAQTWKGQVTYLDPKTDVIGITLPGGDSPFNVHVQRLQVSAADFSKLHQMGDRVVAKPAGGKQAGDSYPSATIVSVTG